MANDDLAHFLGEVVTALDASGVRYMVVGSLASTVHGEPRSTQDVDLVVRWLPSNARRCVSAFDPDRFYLDLDTVLDSVRTGRPCNVISMESGWKADLIPMRRMPFEVEAFERRGKVSVLGHDVWVSSAEDVVIAKLRWSRESGGSERQWRDVRGVVEVQ